MGQGGASASPCATIVTKMALAYVASSKSKNLPMLQFQTGKIARGKAGASIPSFFDLDPKLDPNLEPKGSCGAFKLSS